MKIRHIKIVVFVFTILLMNFQIVFAQMPVHVWVRAEKDVVEIGEPITLTLEMEQPAAFRVFFPEFEINNSGIYIIVPNLEGTLIKQDSSSTSADRILVRRTMQVQAFKIDTLEIPPLAFWVETTNDTIYSTAFVIEVMPVILDTALISKIDTSFTHAVFPEKKPQDKPYNFAEFWYDISQLVTKYAWLIFTILLLAVTLIHLFRKDPSKEKVVIYKPKQAAHKTALDSLSKLKEKQLWQQQHYKEYYSELTNIVRIYLSERYKISALEETSTEILYSLRMMLDTIGTDRLKQIFGSADMVKFAKHTPTPIENEQSIANAEQFVIDTKAEPLQILEEQRIEASKINIIEPAAFKPRLVSFAIDYAILTTIGLVYFLINKYSLPELSAEQNIATSQYPLRWLYFIGIIYVLIEGLTGYSLGKLIMGLQIGSQYKHQAKIQTLLLRTTLKNVALFYITISVFTGYQIGYWIGLGLGLVMTVGYLGALSPLRMAFHDSLAKTTVYNKTDLLQL